MSDPAMWSRAKQVATYIVRDWMLLDAAERKLDGLVRATEIEIDKAFTNGRRAGEAAALERAAKLAESYDGPGIHDDDAGLTADDIAAAIRTLKDKP